MGEVVTFPDRQGANLIQQLIAQRYDLIQAIAVVEIIPTHEVKGIRRAAERIYYNPSYARRKPEMFEELMTYQLERLNEVINPEETA